MQSTQSHFTDMSTQFLRKHPNRRSDLRAVAAIKHPHLSIVQVFKEPLRQQRDRDSDKPHRFRQPPPRTFFTAGDPSPSPSDSQFNSRVPRRGANYIHRNCAVNPSITGLDKRAIRNHYPPLQHRAVSISESTHLPSRKPEYLGAAY